MQKLKSGVILDLRDYNAQGGAVGFAKHMTNNQANLRKIHKSTTSMALQFVLHCPRQPAGRFAGSSKEWKMITWMLELDDLEAVMEQCEAKLLAESEYLEPSKMEEIKRRVLTLFWPMWAVRNLR
ncbi:hypothetical protein HII31_00308 [Pseudocercospora fuligena]|uniref:Uncharacterized protein n=1 Tax=Pseudocercospora fuligena TaxID=685502 RepID=A0A8H6VS46_9PEZI|nr:hypothetical protein HII31_00308 [Pseudocercospora fuligena]